MTHFPKSNDYFLTTWQEVKREKEEDRKKGVCEFCRYQGRFYSCGHMSSEEARRTLEAAKKFQEERQKL